VQPAKLQQAKRLRDARGARDSLATFIRRTWHAVEDDELQWNWHLDVICDRLERVAVGDIQRLVVCIPPGMMKSLTVSVFYPAWRWLHNPARRLQFLSGSNSVRKRDSRRTRKVVRSKWFAGAQEAMEREWQMAGDQDTKINFENSHGGFRQCMTIGGKITGDRADEQICDDPYDVKEATKGEEARVRERMNDVIHDWDNVLANRLNDVRTNPRILIMQRLHPADLAGELIERGWEHVVLPMEYEPDHPHLCDDDPRDEKGELLFPTRYPREVVDNFKQSMLSEQYAAQYQQRPVAKGGAVVKSDWLRRWSHVPDDGKWAQSWDLRAGGDGGESSYAVGQLWCQPADKPGEAWLVDQKRGRWDITETLGVMESEQTETPWPKASAVLVEEKADGRAVVPMLERKIAGLMGTSPKGSKLARLEAVAPFFKSGSVRLPSTEKRGWITEYVSELTTFPSAPNDDQVDATSQALKYLLVDDQSSGWSMAMGGDVVHSN